MFQPTDPDADARASIDAWVTSLGLNQVQPALALDATADAWPIQRADVVVCINMIHIAPWAATIGLMRGAAKVLPASGKLFMYGPFRRGGQHTAPSNAAFDQDLRARNPERALQTLATTSDMIAGHENLRVDPLTLARHDLLRGLAYEQKQDWSGALQAYDRSRSSYRAALGDDHPLVALVDLNRTAALNATARSDEAAGVYSAALARLVERFGSEAPAVLWAKSLPSPEVLGHNRSSSPPLPPSASRPMFFT